MWWDLVALNTPILSLECQEHSWWSLFLIKLQVKGNSEAMVFLGTFQNVRKRFNEKYLNDYHCKSNHSNSHNEVDEESNLSKY